MFRSNPHARILIGLIADLPTVLTDEGVIFQATDGAKPTFMLTVDPITHVRTWTLLGGGGGGVPPLKFTVFVGKNGNDGTADGSIGKPFLTVQAAMEFAWTTYVQPAGNQGPLPPYLRPCVVVAAGTYDDGPLVFPPNICVMGQGIVHTLITGLWTIDSRWNNPTGNNDTRSSWINLALRGDVAGTAPVIDINFGAPIESAQGQLYAEIARFVGPVTLTERLDNPVSNSLETIACEFYGDLTFNGIPVNMENTYQSGTITLNQQTGSGVDNVFATVGGSCGSITVNAPSNAPLTPPYVCSFGHSVQPGSMLTLNGQFSTINVDISAVPLETQTLLAGGATLAQIVPVNGSFGLAYDDTIVAPPLGATNVQAAIDALKSSAPTLAAVLAVGDHTGGTSIIVDRGDSLDAVATPIPGQAGAAATIIAGAAAGNIRVTGLAAMTAQSVVGHYLALAGATTPANNGNFPVVRFVNANTVEVANPAGAAPDASLAISWVESSGPLAIGPDATSFALGSAFGGEGRPMFLLNQGGQTLHGSNSGIQYGSTFASRAQIRMNQYGPNTGVPGISSFKSRGATVGALAPVAIGDVIFRDTAVGVTDNLSIPIGAMISINVTSVPPAAGYVSTEYELQLVPTEGPANGRKVMFKVSSQGVPMLRETALPAGGHTAGFAVTGPGGTIAVANVSVKNPGTRVTLTIQPGGAAPTGGVWVSSITAGTGFTIQSLTNDVGVQVYWQIWEGI